MIRWRRLIQPGKPAFWLMLALNALSTALIWIVQNRTLVPVAALLVAVFAIGNAVLVCGLPGSCYRRLKRAKKVPDFSMPKLLAGPGLVESHGHALCRFQQLFATLVGHTGFHLADHMHFAGFAVKAQSELFFAVDKL